jgi:type IV pilus assembly protein PilB
MATLHAHESDKAAGARRPGTGQSGRRRFLGEMLVQQGIISNDQLQEVLKLQEAEKGARIGRLLIDHAYVTETQLAELIADQLRIPCVDVSAVTIAPEILKLLPRELAVKHLCLPWFKERRQVGLVMADPTNVAAIDAVGFALGMTVQPLVAAETQVVAALARYYGADELASSVVTTFEQIDLASQLALVDEIEPDRHVDPVDAMTAANTGPVIKLVNGILADAIHADASDIHIEPQEKGVALRYRVDGALRHVMTMPKRAQLKIASRVKIMAHMDIAERRKPQDGRMRLVLDGEVYNLRVSTLPTADGEKLVIRILVQNRAHGKLEDLGFAPDVLASLKELLRRPQGIILVTGPTGSGKTSTLYAALNVLRDETRNIVTIEDPIEYRLPGVTQVAVAEKAGLTFAAGLRSILRQDPDIVMVGEIRDPETAKVAFQAAQTGHLVLATLHTNDAASAVTRLLEMGVPAYLVASSVIAVQAQRLVRRYCACRGAVSGSARGTIGCEGCRSTGLRGRIGIFELLRVTPKVRAVLLSGGSDDDIRAAAVASGMRTMFEDGKLKVEQGLTDMAEVLRVVLPPEEQAEAAFQNAPLPAAQAQGEAA